VSPGGDPIERLRRVAVVLAVAAFAAVAALAVSLVFFALPQADDFVLAAAGREEGWIQYATGIYRGWSGRWSGHAIIAGVHSTVDLTHSYPLVIAGSLAIHLMGVYLLVRTTLGSGLSTRATFVLAIVAFSLL
jgi:hypothetical protein